MGAVSLLSREGIISGFNPSENIEVNWDDDIPKNEYVEQCILRTSWNLGKLQYFTNLN